MFANNFTTPRTDSPPPLGSPTASPPGSPVAYPAAVAHNDAFAPVLHHQRGQYGVSRHGAGVVTGDGMMMISVADYQATIDAAIAKERDRYDNMYTKLSSEIQRLSSCQRDRRE